MPFDKVTLRMRQEAGHPCPHDPASVLPPPFFQRLSSGCRRGFFFLKEKRQLKNFPPSSRKTWRRWGQKGHTQESGIGVEAEERQGSFRGLRKKDRKSPVALAAP